MYHALCKVIASLDPKTQIFCGHEYTVKNLEFAQTIEPDNVDLEQKLKWARAQRSAGFPTIPSTVAEEKSYNPFMRVEDASVAQAVGLSHGSPVEVMAELRRRKDKF